MAVALTFDFQGGEDIRPDRNGKIDHEAWTQAEYGPKTGIWRILRILEETRVKASFMTCGGIAERYPDAVRAIVQAGHEIAGHGYHHEVARDLSREEESEVMRRTTDMIFQRTGKRPVGWRSCTQSSHSLELLMEHGYRWNSNSFSHDVPFVWQAGASRLIELPRQPFGDGRVYGRKDSGNPSDALLVWKPYFDELYQESSFKASFCPFQFHPYISSRPGRAAALRQMIEYIQAHKGVWFATGSEVADWFLAQAGTAPSASGARTAVAV